MPTREQLPEQVVSLLSVPGVAATPAMAIHHATLQKYAAQLVQATDTTPLCLRCGTDDNLVYPEYREQRTLPNGEVEPAWARYCCTRCGAGRQHSVPASWRPPGWFWCT